MGCLVLWEIGKKQKYIFKSNKLVEIIGASLIIKEVTEEFDKYGLKDENFIIKKGGKSLYNFESEEQARAFNKSFSEDIFRKYPGIEIFMVIRSFDEEKENITECIDDIYMKLDKKKRMRQNSTYQIAFGMERGCSSTGLPASFSNTEDGVKSYYSRESHSKQERGKGTQVNAFQKLLPKGYEGITTELDKMVKENSKGYIAVVHIDGNSMGKKFKSIKDIVKIRPEENIREFNQRYVKILKKFSEEINDKYEDAFRYTMDIVDKNKEELEPVCNIDDGFFPVRPLILAGDDITYISNGYIGIESARIFLERLSCSNLKIGENDFGTLFACAGIAIIKKGYPFVKGYELAEDLCRNAKRILVENNDKNLSALDFHVAQGEISCGIDYIRKEEYSLGDNESILTMRPLVVGSDLYWRNYDNFKMAYHNIQKAIHSKEIGRNKIKRLRSEMLKGEESVRHFVEYYSIDVKKYLQPTDGDSDYCFNNKEGGRCMYLDSIEVMDIFMELSEVDK